MKLSNIWIVVMALVISGIFSDCKKYADPAPFIQDELDTSSITLKTRKVLLINIDELGGGTLEKNLPANITSLLSTAKYNFQTYEGDTSTISASWKSIMSGKTYSQHTIYDSTWIAPQIGGDFEDERPYYASFLEYLLMMNPKLKTYAVTAWDGLYNNGGFLYSNAQNLTANDQVTTDSVVAKVSNGNYGLLVAEFNSYALAGKQNGFDATTTISKIKDLDGYIGKIMEAIKNRPTYNDEEWLVILNSQYGGDGVNILQKGFRIMSNSALTKELVQKTGFYTAWTASRSKDETAIMQPDGGYYDPGEDDFTISFDLLLQPGSRIYPDIIGKAGTINKPGWAIFQNESSFELDINSASNIRYKRFNSKKNISDGNWHNISFTMEGDQSHRVVYVYVDGVRDSTGAIPLDISNIGAIASSDPMTLGVLYEDSDNGLPVAFHNIKIWRAALTPEDIAKAVQTVKMEDNPKFSSMIGYWSCDDGHNQYFKNAFSSKQHFVLGNGMDWTQVSAPPTFDGSVAETDFSIDPLNADLAPNVFTWLRTTIKSDWGWPDPWLSDFSYEYGIEPQGDN